MSVEPKGWLTTGLGELVSLRTGPFGSSLHKSDYVANGVPLVNPMHISDSRITPTSSMTVSEETAQRLKEFRLTEGDLVLGRRGEMGRCAVIGPREEGWLCGTGSLIVRPNPHFLDPRFLQLFLASDQVVQYLLSASVGSTMANLNQQHLLKLEVRIPPLAEQTRIVAKLEELLSDLDAGVAELKAAQAKLAQYRQSLLKAAVEGALTADWRARRAALETDRPAQPAEAENRPRPAEFHASFAAGQRRRHETPPTGGCAVLEDSADGLETGAELLARILAERRARWEARQLARFQSQGKTPPKGWQSKYPEPVAPDTRDLPELPEGWVWATVDQLADVGTGVTPLKSNKLYFQDGTIPWVTSGALNAELVTEASSHVTELALQECRLTLYPAGSLLIAMYGEGKTRGKCSELGISATINQAIAAVALEPAACDCKSFIKTFLWHSYERMREQASGGVQPNLNLQIIRSITVPLPTLAEQARIGEVLATQLEACKSQEEVIDKALNQSAAQRQNLLKAAFSGQLVPQDPNDEPASVLLERIRAERTASSSARKRPLRKVSHA